MGNEQDEKEESKEKEMNDAVYDTCKRELDELVNKWVKKWYKAPYNPNLFSHQAIERLLLENLYEVHNEICDTV